MGWGGLGVLQLRQVSGPLLQNTARSTVLQKGAIVSVEQVGFQTIVSGEAATVLFETTFTVEGTVTGRARAFPDVVFVALGSYIVFLPVHQPLCAACFSFVVYK